MSIIEALGSRRRIATALTSLLGEDEIRALCDTHRLSVPGFRIGRGPVPLLARSIATACEKNRRVRGAIEAKLLKLAEHNAGAEASPVERLAVLESLATGDARSLLASALANEQTDVVRAAVGVVDAIEAGRTRFPSGGANVPSRPDARGPERPRSHAERAPESRTRAPQPAHRAEPLDELRREVTRLESTQSRLREQLAAEREAHGATRRELKQLRAQGRHDPVQGRALDEARARLRQRDGEVVELHTALESARADLAALIAGARTLEALLAKSAADPRDAPPARPVRPRTESSTPPESKIRAVTSDFWPARTHAFLERLAGDSLVDAIHIIGASSGRTSRVIADIPPGAYVAQFSDGHRAAQLLILTTADSRSSHYWVRRHLAAEYFDGR